VFWFTNRLGRYVFGLSTRNVMLQSNGQLFMTNFDTIYGRSKRDNSLSRLLTNEVRQVIVGNSQSDAPWSAFAVLCARAFAVLRLHSSLIVNILHAGMPRHITMDEIEFVAMRLAEPATEVEQMWFDLVART
jgi:hypothetical protein